MTTSPTTGELPRSSSDLDAWWMPRRASAEPESIRSTMALGSADAWDT
jgi:hypothetical protein